MRLRQIVLSTFTLAAILTGCGDPPAAEGCDDGLRNQDEVGVDCGGMCRACPAAETCFDDVQNQDETAIDCGGVCEACPGPLGTCDDGAQNQGEAGVDCGGPCDACPTCDDGVQNGAESGVDCGGACDACPTCTDNVQNGAETGVDCGGVCGACPTCSDGQQNGAETGVDCGGACPACENCVPLAHRLFMTSQAYDGDLTAPTRAPNGLAGADAICQLHASTAGLGGTWRAWLSDSATDAIDRINDSGPWYLVDRCTQRFASKQAITFTGPTGELNVDENGVAVHPAESGIWSGTDRFGHFNRFPVCDDWTDNTGRFEGGTGSPYFDWDTEAWTDFVTEPCGLSNRLLCLEQ